MYVCNVAMGKDWIFNRSVIFRFLIYDLFYICNDLSFLVILMVVTCNYVIVMFKIWQLFTLNVMCCILY